MQVNKKRRYIRVASVILLFVILWTSLLEKDLPQVYAGTYDNAYTYYNTYKNRMIFVPASSTDGNIYYATRAKRTSSNILFSNIGWKAIVRDVDGRTLQEVYYKMDGNYLKTKDIRTASDGYEYSLYAVSLKDFKSRLNSITLAKLEAGNCSIVFDACIIIKYNGVPSGGMTDNGITWGTVYTTYDGVVNAVLWSEVTRNSLLSYYDKVVEGLFYRISLDKDSGISYVLGAGNYCYGTVVNLYAAPKTGYSFCNWSGDLSSTLARISVTVTKNLAYKAHSIQRNLEVIYHRNLDLEDTTKARDTLTYGVEGQSLKDFHWSNMGYYQTGWKYNRNGLGADYETEAIVTSDWMQEHMPSVTLYGNWSPNLYTVTFDPNGAPADPPMPDRDVNYESVIILPECGYQQGSSKFLGWSLKADDTIPRFSPFEEVQIARITRELGVENHNGASIVFYAIWDNMPAINTANIYVSLTHAKEGKVTEEYIASFATAEDKEDGKIFYGTHDHNSFVLKNYQKELYLNAEEEGYVTETFRVTDSSGNSAERSIRVYLVDTTVYTEDEVYGSIRFINEKYFMDGEGNLISEEDGGLNNKSIWRKSAEFRNILKQLFEQLSPPTNPQ